MKRLIFGLVAALALSACSSAPSEFEQRLGPSFASMDIPGGQVAGMTSVRMALRPFTRVETVESLEVSFRLTGRPKPGGRGKLLSSVPETRAVAEALAARRLDAPFLKMAQAVARTTFCPTGPVTLGGVSKAYRSPEAVSAVLRANGGNLFGANTVHPTGVGETPLQPIHYDINGSDAVNVRLRCNAPNPYYASVAKRSSPSTSGPVEPSALRAYAGGKTFVTHDRVHGTQVVSLSSDGRAMLWYPGNTVVNAGTWAVEPMNRMPNVGAICYAYGPRSYNPATRTAGGRSCTAAGPFHASNEHVLSGDPFGLASGAVPFVLDRKRAYSLAALRRG